MFLGGLKLALIAVAAFAGEGGVALFGAGGRGNFFGVGVGMRHDSVIALPGAQLDNVTIGGNGAIVLHITMFLNYEFGIGIHCNLTVIDQITLRKQQAVIFDDAVVLEGLSLPYIEFTVIHQDFAVGNGQGSTVIHVHNAIFGNDCVAVQGHILVNIQEIPAIVGAVQLLQALGQLGIIVNKAAQRHIFIVYTRYIGQNTVFIAALNMAETLFGLNDLVVALNFQRTACNNRHAGSVKGQLHASGNHQLGIGTDREPLIDGHIPLQDHLGCQFIVFCVGHSGFQLILGHSCLHRLIAQPGTHDIHVAGVFHHAVVQNGLILIGADLTVIGDLAACGDGQRQGIVLQTEKDIFRNDQIAGQNQVAVKQQRIVTIVRGIDPIQRFQEQVRMVCIGVALIHHIDHPDLGMGDTVDDRAGAIRGGNISTLIAAADVQNAGSSDIALVNQSAAAFHDDTAHFPPRAQLTIDGQGLAAGNGNGMAVEPNKDIARQDKVIFQDNVLHQIDLPAALVDGDLDVLLGHSHVRLHRFQNFRGGFRRQCRYRQRRNQHHQRQKQRKYPLFHKFSSFCWMFSLYRHL